MSSDSTLEKVQAILRRIVSDPALVVSMQTTAREVRGWDSLNHMHMIAETEARFGVRFTFDEARSLQNVGDLVRLIERKTTC